jgi:hypothetical protein
VTYILDVTKLESMRFHHATQNSTKWKT